MISDKADKYIYKSYQIIEDIFINSPSGSFSSKMEEIVFKTLQKAAKKNMEKEWYLVENLSNEIIPPKRPLERVIEHYLNLKKSGCRKIIFISKLPIVNRHNISYSAKMAGLEYEYMPTVDHAIKRIIYLKSYE